MTGLRARVVSAPGWLLAVVLLVLFVLPLFALVVSTSGAQLRAGLADPHLWPALRLSLRTTLVSLGIVIVTGTPLAWWLARSRARATGVVSVLVDLPIVVPPAVIGVALLQTFGRQGLLGPTLASWDYAIAFTETAVVIAQVIVSGPFFVQAATNAFRKVEPEMLAVARTLGASPREAFFRIAVPVALPGLLTGTSLAWARALGEFGATLLFAGNMPGKTQTMPLAIFAAMESDLRVAVVFSLLLVAIGAVLLLSLQLVPRLRWATETT